MTNTVRACVIWWSVVAAPAFAQFCPGLPPWVFDDVSSTHPFCTDITWMAQRGVTLGCTIIDPNHRLYCPNDSVTRGQMAAFMHRLGQSLFPLTCAAGQLMKWDGLSWSCANDNIGGSGGGGTVTSVAASTGLQATPNPIVGAGTLSLAPAYRLPQACTSNQVAKWNGSAWVCASDVAGPGTVTSVATGAGLTGGPITSSGTIAVNTTTIQARVSGQCAAGSSIRVVNADGTVTCQSTSAGGTAWSLTGNAGTNPASDFMGTSDASPLIVRAGNVRVLRLEGDAVSPNIIGGNFANTVATTVRGATIAGGGVDPASGDPTYDFEAATVVHDHYGTIGGGYANTVGTADANVANQPFGTVAGGAFNRATAAYAAVAGGGANYATNSYASVGGGEGGQATGMHATVAGGHTNRATGTWSSIGGGGGLGADCPDPPSGLSNRLCGNQAAGQASTIAGGAASYASHYGTVGGGYANTAGGDFSTVPGGTGNIASGTTSFAAGRNAHAVHDRAFVWNSALASISSTGGDQFTVNAPGGIRMLGASGSCTLTNGSSGWQCASDRALKSDIVTVDGTQILDSVAALPIARWSFSDVPGVMHMGPMAQDFHAAFALGDDPTRLAPMDVQGVALAAIQGLIAKLDAKDREIDTLRRALAALAAKVEQLARDR